MCSSYTNIYISGCFSNVGGATAAYRVAMWNSQAWTSLAPSPTWCYRQASCSPVFNSIAVSGSNVYVTGLISPLCGSTYPQGLAEFKTDGSGLISNDSDNLWVHDLQTGAPSAAVGGGLCIGKCGPYVTGNFDMIGSSTGSGGVTVWGVGKRIGTWKTVLTGTGAKGLKLLTNPGSASSLAADTYNIWVLAAVSSGYRAFDSADSVSTDNIAIFSDPAQ